MFRRSMLICLFLQCLVLISKSRLENVLVSKFKVIDLPVVFFRPYIPIDRNHIAKPDSFANFHHLKGISSCVSYFPDIEVGLLIGFDCAQASVPLNVVLGSNISQPYAVQTPLGWTIIGSRLPSNSNLLVPASLETSNLAALSTSNRVTSTTPRTVTSNNVAKPIKCSSLLVKRLISSSLTTVSCVYQHRSNKTVHSNRRNLRQCKFDPSSSIQTIKKSSTTREIPTEKPCFVNYIV